MVTGNQALTTGLMPTIFGVDVEKAANAARAVLDKAIDKAYAEKEAFRPDTYNGVPTGIPQSSAKSPDPVSLLCLENPRLPKMKPGDRGDDVEELQITLAMDYGVLAGSESFTGVYDKATTEAVKGMQEMLIDKGYLKGKITGNFDLTTRAAHERFITDLLKSQQADAVVKFVEQ